MNSLLKQMKAEKTPQLKKYICLPLLLSPDRDEELLKLTEHRCGLKGGCH
jgi:mediator of RNA polymerase II transcription subunit 8